MSEHVKYTFDTEFDRYGNTVRERPPRPKTRFTAEDVEAARADGFAEGQSSVEAKTQEATAQAVNAALATITAQLGDIIGTLQGEVDRVRAEGARLSLETTRHLMETALERHGADHLEAIIKEALSTLRTTSQVTIRLAPAMAEELAGRIEAAAQAAGFTGHLEITPDDTVDSADCALSWADGGAFSNWAEGLEALRTMIREHLEAEGNTQLDLFDQ